MVTLENLDLAFKVRILAGQFFMPCFVMPGNRHESLGDGKMRQMTGR